MSQLLRVRHLNVCEPARLLHRHCNANANQPQSGRAIKIASAKTNQRPQHVARVGEFRLIRYRESETELHALPIRALWQVVREQCALLLPAKFLRQVPPFPGPI